MKQSQIFFLLGSLILALSLAACGGQAPADQVQTAVAETVAALPTQPQEATQVLQVTQIVEVTKIVIVGVTATPAPPTPTARATDTPAVSPTPAEFIPAQPTATATPTPIVESGPLGLTLNQLIRRYTDMTDLQKQEFVKTLPGKTVYWIGEVYNVATDGTIILDNPYGGGRVTLKGVPIETAIQIDKGMLVEFRGMIESFGGTFGREIVVANGEVVRYYFPPTPTPTSSR